MRILITNNTLANRAGSELYVRDLALGLLRRGHEPIAFSTELGDVAEEIQDAGVPVIGDLNELTWQPDIIHGHHHLDTMMALLHCPGTPAIYVCHGSIPWEEAAPRFPRILRYVAVDHACRDRLVLEHAIPEDRIRLVLNFVDLDRFKPRAELPARPQRALIFSNQATYISAARAACYRLGIRLDVVGLGVGNVSANPEALLGNYDIVFAKGRAALEALAVGAAVILCDAAGAGPMVTTENVRQLRPLNFGIRALRETIDAKVILREMRRYDPEDATEVSKHVRATAGFEAALDELLSIYTEVLDEWRHTDNGDACAEQRATALYLGELAPRLHDHDRGEQALAAKETELEMMKSSRSWRMINRYAAIKHDALRPIHNLLARTKRPPSGTRSEGQGAEYEVSQDIFAEIYRRRGWGNGESVSGPGSTLARAAAFKEDLVLLLNGIKTKSLLDAGCGDFNWMKEVRLNLARYVGVDVVAELVAENQRLYGSGSRIFLNLDMTKDSLPRVDVILCRDSLVHLSFKDIFATLANFKKSGSTYLLATTFTRFAESNDIPTGAWRQLNMQLPPFTFPEPVRLIDEKCVHSGGVYADKCLALWALKDIP